MTDPGEVLFETPQGDVCELPDTVPYHVNDGIDEEHVRSGHMPRDTNNCTTFANMALIHTPHFGQTGKDRLGVYCGDLAGPLHESMDGNKWMFVVVHVKGHKRFVGCFPRKTEANMTNLITECKIMTRGS